MTIDIKEFNEQISAIVGSNNVGDYLTRSEKMMLHMSGSLALAERSPEYDAIFSDLSKGVKIGENSSKVFSDPAKGIVDIATMLYEQHIEDTSKRYPALLPALENIVDVFEACAKKVGVSERIMGQISAASDKALKANNITRSTILFKDILNSLDETTKYASQLVGAEDAKEFEQKIKNMNEEYHKAPTTIAKKDVLVTGLSKLEEWCVTKEEKAQSSGGWSKLTELVKSAFAAVTSLEMNEEKNLRFKQACHAITTNSVEEKKHLGMIKESVQQAKSGVTFADRVRNQKSSKSQGSSI
jgi:hypothetical protein